MSTIQKKVNDNTQKQETKKVYKEKGFTIYWKGDSAIALKEMLHKRDDQIKGHKLAVTITPDTFNTKYYIYLEESELLDIIILLKGFVDKTEAKRNKDVSSAIKNLSFFRLNDDILISYFQEGIDKLTFKLNKLNTLVLYKMLKELILNEIKRTTYISLSNIEFEEYLEDLILTKKVKNNTNSWRSNTTNSNQAENQYKFVFKNTFNEKTYDNTIFIEKSKIDQKMVDFVKSNKINKLDKKWKEKIINKLKKLNPEQAKFLNLENVNTLVVS